MSRNTSRVVAAGLASLSLLAVPAAADAAPTKGLQDNAILSDDPALRASFFKDAKASRSRPSRA